MSWDISAYLSTDVQVPEESEVKRNKKCNDQGEKKQQECSSGSKTKVQGVGSFDELTNAKWNKGSGVLRARAYPSNLPVYEKRNKGKFWTTTKKQNKENAIK